MDLRLVEKPIDVISTDKPAEDALGHLALGSKLAQSVMTSGKWAPGDLNGDMGADCDVKDQSPSYAPYARCTDLTERRSATSTGHVFHQPRPRSEGLGWGGYDAFNAWQSYGRQVTKDLVKDEKWPTDRLKPIAFVNQDGDELIVPAYFREEQLPERKKTPLTLFEKIHGRPKGNDKKPKRVEAAWPGTTSKDD